VQLHLIDRSYDLDRTKQQFDVLWDDEPSAEADTVSIITAFKVPDGAIRNVVRPCTFGMILEQAEIVEDAVNKALKKIMGQAFLSGISAGMRASEGAHTADLIYKATCEAIATPVDDEAITPIMRFFQGDVTEFVKILSILLSRVRIEGFVRGWRLTGCAEIDTNQWLSTQDFTPPHGEKRSDKKESNGPLADNKDQRP